jgi:hypothetical protein
MLLKEDFSFKKRFVDLLENNVKGKTQSEYVTPLAIIPSEFFVG